jgi:glutamine transport system permease protein
MCNFTGKTLDLPWDARPARPDWARCHPTQLSDQVIHRLSLRIYSIFLTSYLLTAVLESLNTISEALPNLLLGAGVTLQLTAIAIVIGMIAGSLIGIARLSSSRLISLAARCYVDFFRGTPLLVQIFMIYFGLPVLLREVGLKFSLSQFVAAILALSLNSAAYIAEIVRAGIQSIEIGQREASESLGLGAVQTMRYVIFPQAFRRMIPPLGNEFISMLKDTSLVAVIGFEELFRRGQIVVASNYKAFEIYFSVAIVYLAMTLLFSQLFSWLERWLNPTAQVKKKAIAQPITVRDQ